SEPCPASAGRWRCASTSGLLQVGVVVDLEAPFVAAGGLERRFVAAGLRRVAHRRRGRALVGPLVPPDGAALLLRLDFLGMILEELLHELRQVGLVSHLSL